MEPFKALVLLAAAAIVAFVGAGAVGFYAGYSAGRGNLAEIKATIASGQSVIRMGDGSTVSMKPLLDEFRGLANKVGELAAARANEGVPGASAAIDRSATPLLDPDTAEALKDIRDQVHALNARLERPDTHAPTLPLPPGAKQETRAASNQAALVEQIKTVQASVDALKAALGTERGSAAMAAADLAQLRQFVTTASAEFAKCHTDAASVQGSVAPPGQQASASSPPNEVTILPDSKAEPSALVFYDNVMMQKEQEKQYDEIGVRLALQSVSPRQVKVAVNRQGFGLAFGERKVFRSQDVECEITLMETNLKESQARLSISCRR